MRRVIAQNIEHKKLKNLKLTHKKHYKIGYLLLSGLICLNLLLTSGCADKSAAMPAAQETTAEVSGETVQQPAEAAGETAEKLPAAEADQGRTACSRRGIRNAFGQQRLYGGNRKDGFLFKRTAGSPAGICYRGFSDCAANAGASHRMRGNCPDDGAAILRIPGGQNGDGIQIPANRIV